MSPSLEQPALFDLPLPVLEPAESRAEDRAVAAKLSPRIRLGTTSWSYPGWIGSVYGASAPAKLLSSRGLTAYAKHPLLRAVEVDRTYYEPVPASVLRELAGQVPDGFRFVVKASEECTVLRFPVHARYGKKRGEANPRYLDAAFAASAVVGPFVEGLGPKGGILLFQFPPQDVGEPAAFAESLVHFFAQLPRGVPYAVEIRNEELLTPAYVAALEEAGAVHCHNLWTGMPPLLAQVRRIPPPARRPLVIRWLLRPGDTFEDARARYTPFDRLVDEDTASRALIAGLVSKADRHDVPAFVIIDNKAEGSAPLSAARLAAAIVTASVEP
jgi:uncharacterized protein YecE (DUF72 family)